MHHTSSALVLLVLIVPFSVGARIIAHAARTDHSEGLALNDTSIEAAIGDEVEIKKLANKVYRYKKGDSFVVFESDGQTMTLFEKKFKTSFYQFKEALKNCAEKGKAGIGMYNFRYPKKTSESTLVSKTLYVLSLENTILKRVMKKNIQKVRLQAGVASQVWPKFKVLVGVNTGTMESKDIERDLSPEEVWNKLDQRNDPSEEKSFKEHMGEEAPDDGADTDSEDDDDEPEQHPTPAPRPAPVPTPSPTPAPSRPSGPSTGSSSIDRAELQKMIQQALQAERAEIMKEVKTIAEDAANDVTGRALKKLGAAVGQKISSFGETRPWQAS